MAKHLSMQPGSFGSKWDPMHNLKVLGILAVSMAEKLGKSITMCPELHEKECQQDCASIAGQVFNDVILLCT